MNGRPLKRRSTKKKSLTGLVNYFFRHHRIYVLGHELTTYYVFKEYEGIVYLKMLNYA